MLFFTTLEYQIYQDDAHKDASERGKMSITFDEKSRIFFLLTKNSEYQMQIGSIGHLRHLYYGAPVGKTDMSYRLKFLDRGFSGNPYELADHRELSLDTMPQEYSGSGMGDYRVESLQLIGKTGSRSVDLRYAGHEIFHGKYTIPGLPSVRAQQDAPDTLIVTMKDAEQKLQVRLLYSVFEEKDVITRAVEIRNEGDAHIFLDKAASMCMDFPYEKLDLIHFHGRHCMERQREELRVPHGIVTVGSKRGMSSHHHNPFVILASPGTNENTGDCYGFMLMYSGNHKEEVELDQAGSTRIVMGIHDEHFSWKLEPQESFWTPEVIISRSSIGLNALSQNYHRILRENVCDLKYLHRKRPVLINSWEAAYFSFDTEHILKLAREAKDLGIEMVVLDDGWFGKRDDDKSGLGDWWTNEQKLPGGLHRIADEISRMGLKFGLWLEPEMISEDSELFRTHPDWALCDPNRKPMVARNQLVLDMSRQDVQDYLFDGISRILENAKISYIKWDFNRPVANTYSGLLERDRQGEVTHRFVLGTYALLERLIHAYPEVMIEGCAGGGGRFDAGMLYYTPQIWCSDDTDPIARLKIQKGTSYGYPVSAVGSHVSAVPNHQTGRVTPLGTRGIVAMAGTFGYELDPGKLSDEEKEEIRRQIETFHRHYELIQEGLYYRLETLEYEDYYTAWEHVSKDRSEALVSLVISHVQANPELPCIRLQGLKEHALYRLEQNGQIFSGAALMNGGYTIGIGDGELQLENYPALQLYFKEV